MNWTDEYLMEHFPKVLLDQVEGEKKETRTAQVSRFFIQNMCDLSNFFSEIDIFAIGVNDFKFCVNLGLSEIFKFCKFVNFTKFPFFSNFVQKILNITNFLWVVGRLRRAHGQILEALPTR